MIKLTINGQDHQVDADPITPLLYVLRNELKLNGAKFGCGLGQCGACTVLLDGQPGVFVPNPDLRAGGARHYDARRFGNAGKARSGAAGLYRRTGGAVRLLHSRHDRSRACAVE